MDAVTDDPGTAWIMFQLMLLDAGAEMAEPEEDQ